MSKKKLGGIVKPGDRLSGALSRLEEALTRNPEDFAQRLRAFIPKFRDYSALNRGLIFLQRPDATFVKGRKQWELEGRTVCRGAKSIRILAPNQKKGERFNTGMFVQARIYDISDTQGEKIDVPMLDSAPADQSQLAASLLAKLEKWVRASGLELRYEMPEVNSLVYGKTNGLVIWIWPDLSPGGRLNTLAHEIAHVKLHFRKTQRGSSMIVEAEGEGPSRNAKELEAEITGYLILALYGVDCSVGSATYLNHWKASMRSVRKCAAKVLPVAASVLTDCEKSRYRDFTGEGGVNVRREVEGTL